MAEDPPPLRAPGPWDEPVPTAGSQVVTPAQAAADPSGYRQPARQSPLMAVLSTALLAGIIWYLGSWQLALAGVVGVFVHEYGHVLAMNALGCGPARIHIVPFLGGAASPARPPSTEFRGVLIALAGPVFGLLAALPFLLAADLTHDETWAGGAAFVAVINLINLLPAPPLDGSRVLGPALARIHPVLERVVLVLIGVAALGWAVSRGSYLLAIPIAFGTFSALASRELRYPAVPLRIWQCAVAITLFLVAAACCLLMLHVAVGGAELHGDYVGKILHHRHSAGYRI